MESKLLQLGEEENLFPSLFWPKTCGGGPIFGTLCVCSLYGATPPGCVLATQTDLLFELRGPRSELCSCKRGKTRLEAGSFWRGSCLNFEDHDGTFVSVYGTSKWQFMVRCGASVSQRM